MSAQAQALKVGRTQAEPPPFDLRLITAMSRAVATPQPLAVTLSTIAEAAAELLRSEAAVILLRDGRDRLRFVGGHGVSAGYRNIFDADQEAMPVLEALRTGSPVMVADIETDQRLAPWREAARAEGFRALIALPLTLGVAPIGSLATYRRTPGAWSAHERDFMMLAGACIATAVRTAHLIDEQTGALAAHARVLHGLREQTQRHVERLAGLRTTLDIGDSDDVRHLVAELEDELRDTYARIIERIHNPVVAGMLIGEASIASRKGVAFRLDRRSCMTGLPPGLGSIETVSIVSNLLENAFDAVAGLPSHRRRVTLLVRSDRRRARFRVRDWGCGLVDVSDELVLRPTFTTKGGHSGVGLSIVSSLLESAGGNMTIERLGVGASFAVEVPDA
jgi:signal transduction histidine kinase